jgi:hypothetical protein
MSTERKSMPIFKKGDKFSVSLGRNATNVRILNSTLLWIK